MPFLFLLFAPVIFLPKNKHLICFLTRPQKVIHTNWKKAQFVTPSSIKKIKAGARSEFLKAHWAKAAWKLNRKRQRKNLLNCSEKIDYSSRKTVSIILVYFQPFEISRNNVLLNCNALLMLSLSQKYCGGDPLGNSIALTLWAKKIVIKKRYLFNCSALVKLPLLDLNQRPSD